jgi:hypothetical protein
LGRLRILSVDPVADTHRCTVVLMVLEGVLEIGASIRYGVCYLRVLAMAKPSYYRKIADEVMSDDLISVARQGETVEAVVDMSLFDSPFMDLLYHDFEFQ